MKKLIATLTLLLAGACTTTISGDAADPVHITSRMDRSVFLMPVAPSQRTVYIAFNNANVGALEIGGKVASLIAGKDYTIVEQPQDAHFMLQIDIADISTGYADVPDGEGRTVLQNRYSVRTELQISQRVPESIYLRKIQESRDTRREFGASGFGFDDFDMTQTLGADGQTLHWKVYRATIESDTAPTPLAFDDVAPAIESRIATLIAGVF